MNEENVQPSEKPGTNPSITGSPSEHNTTFHEGEKVKLTVTAQNLHSNGYTDINFEVYQRDNLEILDGDKNGFIVYGGGNPHQTVGSQPAYHLDAVVHGLTGDKENTRWNAKASGSGQQPLHLHGTLTGGDLGYQTKPILAGPLYGARRIAGGVTTFDATNAVKIDGYQINDETGSALAKTFGGYVEAQYNSDLSNFDFWDSTQTKITPVKVNDKKSIVWVESDANGKFTFYITCNYTGGMWVDNFTLSVGDERPTLVQVIAGDKTKVGISSGMPAPKPAIMTGSYLYLNDDETLVSLNVSNTFVPGVFQAGDVLILIVNGVIHPTSRRTLAAGEGQKAPIPDCFTVPVSSLNVAPGTGAKNVLEYLNASNGEVTKTGPFSFYAVGSGQSGPAPNPPITKYLAPSIPSDPSMLEINYDDVKNGLKVKIDWSGSNWTPDPGSTLSLTIQFDGWNVGTTPPDQRVQPTATIPFKVPSPLHGTSLTQTIDYSIFAGFIEDPSGSTNSKMFMQYHVPQSGSNTAGWSKPTPWIEIDTVPPGGL